METHIQLIPLRSGHLLDARRTAPECLLVLHSPFVLTPLKLLQAMQRFPLRVAAIELCPTTYSTATPQKTPQGRRGKAPVTTPALASADSLGRRGARHSLLKLGRPRRTIVKSAGRKNALSPHGNPQKSPAATTTTPIDDTALILAFLSRAQSDGNTLRLRKTMGWPGWPRLDWVRRVPCVAQYFRTYMAYQGCINQAPAIVGIHVVTSSQNQHKRRSARARHPKTNHVVPWPQAAQYSLD